MERRIIRGVRVVTPEGMGAASVHIADGRIVAIAGYHDVPREARPEELGKAVLMPGLVRATGASDLEAASKDAAAGGITTLLASPSHRQERRQWVDIAEAAPLREIHDDRMSLVLPRVWTEMRNRGEAIELIARELCGGPAGCAGLDQRKSKVATGFDADFVVWSPELTVVGSEPLLYGQVRQTIVRGRTVFKDGTLSAQAHGERLADL